jgi:hypothetical protein
MSKIKMNLQQFADRHGLQVKDYAIRGPHGKIFQGFGKLFYIQAGTDYDNPNRVTHANQAIETIGIECLAPPKPINKDRRAFLIAKKADGWYVADKAGPFKTRELARDAREGIKNSQLEGYLAPFDARTNTMVRRKAVQSTGHQSDAYVMDRFGSTNQVCCLWCQHIGREELSRPERTGGETP